MFVGASLLPLCVPPDLAAATDGDACELLDHLLDHLQEVPAVEVDCTGQGDHQQPGSHRQSQDTDSQGDWGPCLGVCALLDTLQCYGSLVSFDTRALSQKQIWLPYYH